MTEQVKEVTQGFDVKRVIAQLTSRPGVYQMLDAEGGVLYVGKARNLKKRVSSYFLRASGSARTEAMVDKVADIAINVTATEDEALILEANLIKKHRPRYNVLFKDDKSYPYIAISGHEYPRIAYHRGARHKQSRYFGPYPAAGAARQTIAGVQKLFRLRPCSDSYFSNRTRPCLQYQINRCTAPCVAKISVQDYAADVAKAAAVLQGKGEQLAHQLQAQMLAASEELAFERAASLRDQLAALRRVQAQGGAVSGSRSLDVVVAEQAAGRWGVVVATVRHGRHLGHRIRFPNVPANTDIGELLSAFLAQHYGAAGGDPPAELVMPQPPDDAGWHEQAMRHRFGRVVKIRSSVRGDRAKLVLHARESLREALAARELNAQSQSKRMSALAELLDLPQAPQRLECFDISHTQGEAAVASCVVFDDSGPLKSAYRRFNIKGITPGDDYAAISQAVSRRFARLKQGEAPLPDVLLIDGGKGQLAQAVAALEKLEIDGVLIVGVAKGSERRVGLEQIVLPGQSRMLRPDANNAGLHIIQHIRDEAHRFAIQGHRGQRGKARTRSPLEEIDGLGPKRRAALLRDFGGIQQVQRAGVDELMRVDGISKALAQRIYELFHS